MTIHLLSSPPFGEHFWTLVRDRLVEYGHDVSIHTPVETHATVSEACEQLARTITPSDQVVAHGLAVPLLLQFAQKHPIDCAFVSNGPLKSLDPLCTAYSTLPTFLQKIYLHPALSFRFFCSSLGFRRAVVNPYVMDKEMVSRTCDPLNKSSFRANSVAYLKDLGSFSPPESLQTRLVAIWGDHDLLYPTTIATELQHRYDTKRIDIEGGKLLHPIERPWAIADIIHQECHAEITPDTSEHHQYS